LSGLAATSLSTSQLLNLSTLLVFSQFPAFLFALMGVPKRKTSKMRLRTRKASHRWQAPQLNKCTQCGSTVASHTACPSCGYYKGRQVLTVGA
jgi:large subunit ribosomal protein L32